MDRTLRKPDQKYPEYPDRRCKKCRTKTYSHNTPIAIGIPGRLEKFLQ